MKNNVIEQKEYSNACKQVLEILKMVKDEDINKIPMEEIEILKKYANNDYEFSYNPQKNIKEQNVSKLAKAIIANYFIDYIATPNQKQKIINKQKYDIKLSEEEKSKKYNSDDIIKNRKVRNNVNSVNLPIEIKKESFLIKILGKIKSLLKKGKT